MKITIKAEPKEIAALVVAIQERTVLSDNLIVERDSLITVLDEFQSNESSGCLLYTSNCDVSEIIEFSPDIHSHKEKD